MDETIELRVNGSRRQVRADPTTPLLYVLRNHLGLTGAKFGCGSEQCGACAVLVAGESVLSCGLAVGRVGNREVTTVEGLGAAGELGPRQQGFLPDPFSGGWRARGVHDRWPIAALVPLRCPPAHAACGATCD